jgi:hypothetical protein
VTSTLSVFGKSDDAHHVVQKTDESTAGERSPHHDTELKYRLAKFDRESVADAARVRGSGLRDAIRRNASVQLFDITSLKLHRISLAQLWAGLMGEVVNLKRFKKRTARDAAAKEADARRARFGRSKTERKQQEEQNRKLDMTLDRHHIGEDQL